MKYLKLLMASMVVVTTLAISGCAGPLGGFHGGPHAGLLSADNFLTKANLPAANS
ncbi:MAG: hypothetical protein ACJAZP_000848 [Psychromonas sp.]|jgi:hypothetical protein|uniref:hypothetical protein n=1 Tax=Psychromonas sp. TaxID=1884585 RepID=UPI0039E2A934